MKHLRERDRTAEDPWSDHELFVNHRHTQPIIGRLHRGITGSDQAR
jgi:hypothetical protein